jgi:hypothetical protein
VDGKQRVRLKLDAETCAEIAKILNNYFIIEFFLLLCGFVEKEDTVKEKVSLCIGAAKDAGKFKFEKK